METSLKLQMPDGVARVRFHPRLNAEQYAELLMRIVDIHTQGDLQSLVGQLASKWGKQHELDSVLE